MSILQVSNTSPPLRGCGDPGTRAAPGQGGVEPFEDRPYRALREGLELPPGPAIPRRQLLDDDPLGQSHNRTEARHVMILDLEQHTYRGRNGVAGLMMLEGGGGETVGAGRAAQAKARPAPRARSTAAHLWAADRNSATVTMGILS